MSRPAFLDAPFTRERFSAGRLFDYVTSVTEEERRPAVTEEDKDQLRQQFPNSDGCTSSGKDVCDVWAKRTQYSCTKIIEGVFKVDVYAISNRMDTSRPKNTYFLIRKAEN